MPEKTSDKVSRNLQIRESEVTLYRFAAQLYTKKEVVFRELLQNSIDSGATEVNITWKDAVISLAKDGQKTPDGKPMILVKPERIEFIDNGKGMSRQFLLDEFWRIGKTFKKGGEIGHYGIGRLTAWSYIVEKKGNEIKHNGEVAIVTADGNRKSRLQWRSLSDYEVLDGGPSKEHGTRVIIEGTMLKLPTPANIVDALRDMVVHSDLKIFVNGVEFLPPIPHYQWRASRKFSKFGSSWLHGKEYGFRAQVGIGIGKFTIAENGLVIEESPYAPISGVIDIKRQGNGSSEEDSILSLSRDSCLLDQKQVYMTFLLTAAVPQLQGLSPEMKKELHSTITDVTAHIITELKTCVRQYSKSREGKSRYSPADRKDMAKSLQSLFQIPTFRIGDKWFSAAELASTKAVFTKGSFPELVAKTLRKEGYLMLSSATENQADILRFVGVLSLKDMVDRLGENVVIRDPKDAAEKAALQKCAETVEVIGKAVESGMPELRGLAEERRSKAPAQGNHSDVFERHPVLYKFMKGVDNVATSVFLHALKAAMPFSSYFLLENYVHRIDRLHALPRPSSVISGEGISVAGVSMHIGEKSPLASAFESNGRLSLNVNNPTTNMIVRNTAVRNEVADKLAPTLLHEYVHGLGFSGHNEDFAKVQFNILNRMILEELKREGEPVAQPVKAKAVNQIGGLDIGAVEIPKETAERLGIAGGSVVQLLLRKDAQQ